MRPEFWSSVHVIRQMFPWRSATPALSPTFCFHCPLTTAILTWVRCNFEAVWLCFPDGRGCWAQFPSIYLPFSVPLRTVYLLLSPYWLSWYLLFWSLVFLGINLHLLWSWWCLFSLVTASFDCTEASEFHKNLSCVSLKSYVLGIWNLFQKVLACSCIFKYFPYVFL